LHESQPVHARLEIAGIERVPAGAGFARVHGSRRACPARRGARASPAPSAAARTGSHRRAAPAFARPGRARTRVAGSSGTVTRVSGPR
jgi:hypothetical protein